MTADQANSTDEESQPLTEGSTIFQTSGPSSPRRASSSTSASTTSASTTSIVLDHLHGHESPGTKGLERYTDSEDPQNIALEELDIEDAPLLRNKPVDAKYRRWLWILGAICCAGWILAFILFAINGSYKHRSTVAHDPLSTSSAGSGKKITIDQLQTGHWMPKGHGISWISNPTGEDGMILEKNAPGKPYLVVEDVRGWENMTETTDSITLMEQAGFDADGQYVFPEDVWPSPDLKTVLIMSDRKHNWRHSFTGHYWLFSVETQTGQALDPSNTAGRIQLATWSPNSDAVVFTRENDMFLREVHPNDTTPRVIQITTNGGADTFNGVPDWVYEEEVFSGNSATWWSSDGKFIAFLSTNESEVAEYPVQYFLSRPSGETPPPGEESYPETRQIKYPRAGAANPVVHLQFYDVPGNRVFSVPIEDDFPDDDRLITEVVWAGESGKALIRETNRESDVLKMVLIDVARRQGQIVRTQDVNALDGGWFEISETTTFVPRDSSNGRLDDGYIDTIIYEGFDHLAYFSPLDNPDPQMLTTGEWEVVSAPSAVDLKSNLVYFVATKESSIQRHIYKVSLGGTGLEPLTDSGQEGYYDASFSKGAGYALLSYQGPDIPWQKIISTPSLPESFTHTVEENRDLFKMAAAHELPLKIHSTINIDGYELNVVERRPPHFDPRKQYPVLFQLYGGPGSQSVDRKFSVDFQSYVASSLGYLVVTVDGRGTGFIGRKARCIVRGDIGHYEGNDQIEAAKIWAGKPYVDAGRIAIWGWSYGGFLTLKTLEMDGGRTFKYGMAVAPVTDWKFYGRSTPPRLLFISIYRRRRT